MFLVRLIYASRVTQEFNEHSIEDILSKAKQHNAKSQVTGLLCFSSSIFLQCLEGSRTAVNRTYHKILNDPRHTDIILLDYKEVVARAFSSWNMGYVPDTQITNKLNLTYSGTTSFNPFEMHGESCEKVLMDLARTIETV